MSTAGRTPHCQSLENETPAAEIQGGPGPTPARPSGPAPPSRATSRPRARPSALPLPQLAFSGSAPSLLPARRQRRQGAWEPCVLARGPPWGGADSWLRGGVPGIREPSRALASRALADGQRAAPFPGLGLRSRPCSAPGRPALSRQVLVMKVGPVPQLPVGPGRAASFPSPAAENASLEAG